MPNYLNFSVRFGIVLILLFSNFSCGLAQLKGIVIDHKSKEVIPFANIWVENEDIGTSAGTDGEFLLNNADSTKWIIISAIGYESKRGKLKQGLNTIHLNPKTIRLQEVVVKPGNKNYQASIGKFNKRKINHYYGCGGNPWITARYFEYKKEYKRTGFIKEIKVLTSSDVKDAKFNVRFYKRNVRGEPEDFLLEKYIIAVADKGTKITKIDISDLHIRFPAEGLFIALEWLIIEENKHEYVYTLADSKKKLSGLSYEPAFGTVQHETNEGYVYVKGGWDQESNLLKSRDDETKFRMLAMELILSN